MIKRVFAVLLVSIMLLVSLPAAAKQEQENSANTHGVSLTSQTEPTKDFVPRLSMTPETAPAYYTTLNFFYNHNLGMPNCTCYAYGRAYEILGHEPNLCHGNAKDWWNYNKNNNYYPYGRTPALGAVVCWTNDEYGHVAVVEQIDGDYIITSESSWNPSRYFFTTRRSMSGLLNNSEFQGFIYIYGGDSIPTPSKPEIIETATCIDTWFQWRPCENTLSYDVRVYHDGETEPCAYAYGVSSTYWSFHLDNGTYQMDVAAVNRIDDEWAWSFSDKVTFTVNNLTSFAPEQVEVWNGHTYSLYDYNFVSWIEAKSFCEQNGGHLVTVTSQSENDFVYSMLQGADYNKCWLGGTELNLPSWQWITGEPLNYTNWNDGEPNNAWGIEHYIGMYRDNGGWNDFRTVQSNICIIMEIDSIPTPSKPEIIETATCIDTWFQWRPCENTLSYDVRVYHDGETEPCDYAYGVSSTYWSFHLDNGTYQMDVAAVNRIGDEWAWTFSDKVTFTVNNLTNFVPQQVEVWNGHTYSLYDYNFVSWIEAKSFCEQNGGHLATITSQSENDFVYSMLQGADYNKCWLGGTELNLPSWQWITEEPLNYTNWNDGEPNNAWGIEHYIGMYRDNGCWNDFRTVQSNICIIMETDSVSAALLGDADNNGTVDSVDALLILRYALGIVDSLPSMDNADATGDGVVDSIDALMVLRHALGIITL